MNVRIGLINTVRELDVDLGDDAKSEDVTKDLTKQLSSDLLTITDKKGRVVVVSVEKIAYVEIGVETPDQRVGFTG